MDKKVAVCEVKRERLVTVLTLAMMLCLFAGMAYAQSVGFSGDTVGEGSLPWTKILNTLAKELTGPLPMTLGILGLAAAAVAMFTGNGGGGTQKFIMLIFAISTCLFAPTFISWVSKSAGGATITDVAASAQVLGSTLLP